MYLTAGELVGGTGRAKEAQCKGHRMAEVVGKTQEGNVEGWCLCVNLYRNAE